MKIINNLEELELLYDPPIVRSVKKVTPVITPLYRQWIEASRFLVMATVGEEGCDSSPRGDIDNLVKITDMHTIWLPDWRGNNRLDSLRNIVRDGRISLMFMVNGCNNVVRVNGNAVLTIDQQARNKFLRNNKAPKTVIVVNVKEVYFQCAKALMRSDLWNAESTSGSLPSAGDFTKEQDNTFDSKSYDDGYDEYAKKILW